MFNLGKSIFIGVDSLFKASKAEIINAVMEVVKSFDIKCHTCLQTDWCKEGIGYILLQQHYVQNRCTNLLPGRMEVSIHRVALH